MLAEEQPPSKDSGPTDLPLAEAQSTRPPSAMPVPAAPRRAAPPRKKAAKSPSPAATLQTEDSPTPEMVLSSAYETTVPEVQDSLSKDVSHFVHDDARVVEKLAESTVEQDRLDASENLVKASERGMTELPSLTPETHTAAGAEEVSAVGAGDAVQIPVKETPVPPTLQEKPESLEPIQADPSREVTAPATADAEADDIDDESARRIRVAEKLVKMGGVNPFAPPSTAALAHSSEETVLPESEPAAESTKGDEVSRELRTEPGVRDEPTQRGSLDVGTPVDEPTIAKPPAASALSLPRTTETSDPVELEEKNVGASQEDNEDGKY